MKTEQQAPQGASDRAEKLSEINRAYERSDLPFVRADGHGETNCWAVNPSGDAEQDFETGGQYGRLAVAFAEQVEDSTQLLVHVFRDIVAAGRFGHLEAGFVDAMAIAGITHHNSLRMGWIERGLFGEPIVYPGFSVRRRVIGPRRLRKGKTP